MDKYFVFYRNSVCILWLSKGLLSPFLAIMLASKTGQSYGAALIYSMLLFSTAFFEIPTGAWADKFGRLKVFLVSQLFFFASLFFLYSEDLWALYCWALISGLSDAIASGSLRSWFVDRIGNSEDKDNLRFFLAKAQSYSLYSMGGAALFSGALLYLYDDFDLIVLFSHMLSFALILYVAKKIGYDAHTASKRSSILSQIYSSLKTIKSNSTLLWLLLSSLSWVAITFSFVNFWQLGVYERASEADKYLSVSLIFSLSIVLQGFGNTLNSKSKKNDFSSVNVSVLASGILISSGILLSGLADDFFTYIGVTCILFIAVGYRMAPQQYLIQTQIPSSQRSTIMSTLSLCTSIIGSLSGYCLSYILKHHTIEQSWIITGGLGVIFSTVNFVVMMKLMERATSLKLSEQ